MKVVKIVFSPTGGTEKVADIVANNISTENTNIDLCNSNMDFKNVDIDKNDMVVIALPSYGGRAPEVAIHRLKEIKGNSAKCIIICVYGNRAYEDTLIELKDLAQANGFNVIAAAAVVTQHSIVPQFGAGRPDGQDKAELAEFAVQVKNKLASQNTAAITVSGNRPYKQAMASAMAPVLAEDKCIGCGTCVIACPTGAIDKSSFECEKAKCISCLRCIKVCPMNCRYVPEEILAKLKAHLAPLCASRKDNEFFI